MFLQLIHQSEYSDLDPYRMKCTRIPATYKIWHGNTVVGDTGGMPYECMLTPPSVYIGDTASSVWSKGETAGSVR